MLVVCYNIITFRVSRSRHEMYIGHARLCVCLSVRGRMPTLPHGSGCNLGEWQRVPTSCALLGGFAIGARVSLLRQHRANAKRQRVLVLAVCLVRFIADTSARVRFSLFSTTLSGCLETSLNDYILCCVRKTLTRSITLPCYGRPME